MDVNSNSYTYRFAVIMVVVVAVVLSGLFLVLKPLQEKNIVLEKRQNILASIGVQVDRSGAEEAFSKYIKQSIVIKNGQVVSQDPDKAFNIDMAAAVKSVNSEREVPLYVAEKEGEQFFIIPLRGKGLWGPVWGYLALQRNGSTVAGATFDHKSETPGLGAEISLPNFMNAFQGKEIMSNNQFVSISVVKAGTAAGNPHAVDGISGGTITSNGVHDMLKDCLEPYVGYFQSLNG